MAQGLQVFNANGDEVFNSSTRTFKVVDRISFEAGKTITMSHPLFNESVGMNITAMISPPFLGGNGIKIIRKGGNTINIEMGNIGTLETTHPFLNTFYMNDFKNLTVLVGVY